jgi:threonine dehydratase
MNSDLSALLAAVSVDAIRAAQPVIYQTLQPSPLLEHPLLNAAVGARVFIKHENHLPTGAFKVRGGLNFMHHFAAAQTEGRGQNGVITATRGNHGQSVALAASHYGIPSTIVVPFGNNPEKNAAMQAFGARLVEAGRDFDEAREAVEQLAAAENLCYVHSANEPHLINGVGSYALEIIETAQQRRWVCPTRLTENCANRLISQ